MLPGSPEEDELRHLITLQLAGMCGIPPAEVDPDRPLTEHGLSSRDTVALAGFLETLLGRALPPTLVWEYPTISSLAAWLANPATDTAEQQRRYTAGPTADAPVAVVGIGCRFPGGTAGTLSGPAAFWDFLAEGHDGISEVPADRWAAFDDGSPGAGEALASVTRRAGALGDIAGFDAAFFGISPAEAAVMDPQQRILLEVCWEALEHAGIPPRSLRGSRTGVFAGLSTAEYAHLTTADLSRIGAWTATGAAGSVAAGRISYLLDLHGPSLAVDTACSSSLLAVHLAAASLRSGESDLALAGGVNLLLSPVITMTFDAAGGTSPDGRCRPFDAAANGMVRGEGCGVVVLKRLPDALRDHDRVLAVITGTAVNSDGRSNGLVAPNGTAQRDLLRAAHDTAGTSPGEVDYVEAHGTGTPLGDPIEARALGEALGHAAQRPLLIGSVKSNIGHLEAAAGIAGLIKTVLALGNRQIPATLHYTEPSPHIPLADLGLRVVSRLTDWPDNPWRPSAGVSAFGFSGTNVHVVLTAAPPAAGHGPPALTGPGAHQVWGESGTTDTYCPLSFVLTDTSAERVARQARALADWLERAPADGAPPLEPVAGTLAERQGRGPHRSVVLAADRAQLSAALRALAEGEAHPAVITGVDGQPGPGAAFVFSGYGSQWAGMGQALAADEPEFAAALAELEEPLRAAAGFSLRQTLRDAAALRDVRHAQPAVFAIQVALARVWEAHGVRPVAVIGHSMGEVAAAVVSGALSVADGARVIATRSRLLGRLAGAGAMALVGRPDDEVTALAADLPELYLAVISSPVQCVVTGDAAQVAELARRVADGGGTARVLQAEGAGHSPQVDPLLGELTSQLDGLSPRLPAVRWYGTTLDDPRTLPTGDPAYWAANLRRPVRLGPAVTAAAQDGLRAFVEVAPHPMLGRALTETLRHETGGPGVITGTLRRDATGGMAFHSQLARLVAGGVRLPRQRGPLLDLPPAPWQHQPHWAPPPPRAAAPGHPLLGLHLELPDGGHAWQAAAGELDGALFPLSAAGEMAVAAACEAWGVAATEVTVTSLRLGQLVPVSAATVLTTTLDGESLRISARDPAGPWLLAAIAQVTAGDGETDGASVRLPVGRFTAAAVPPASGRARGQRIPAPVLADCLAAATAPGQTPVAARLLRARGDAVLGGGCVVRSAADGLTADLELAGPGGPLLDVLGVELRKVPPAAIQVPYRDKIFEVGWQEEELPPAGDGPPRRWVVLSGPDTAPAAEQLASRLRAAGHEAGPPGEVAGAAGVVLIVPPGPLVPVAENRVAADAIQLAASLASGSGPGPRLWIVTAGAVAALPGEAGHPGLAALRGLVRVLGLERPALRATLVDLSPAADAAQWAAALAAELIAGAPDDEVAWRDRRLVARLDRAKPPVPGAYRRVVRPGGGYIVTGGYGGLGLLVARWLAAAGAGRIVLSGRAGPPPGARHVFAELAGTAVVVTGDVAAPGVAERLVATAREGGRPLCGVVHAAGVFADALVGDVTDEDMTRVWRPKVAGAWRLHEATAGAGLDWFVLFSSAAALLGSPGQAVYATANAWLDAFAIWRRAQGLPATSAGWGMWADAGAAASVVLGGIGPIGPDEGVAALHTLLAEDRTTVGVVRIDPAAAAAAYPEIVAMPYFAPLTGGPGGGEDSWTGLAALRAADPAQCRVLAGQRARDQVAAVLGLPADSLPTTLPLTEAGMDSLAAQRICNLLEHDLGVSLEPAALLGGTTLAQLQQQLAAALGTAGTGDGAQAAARIPGADTDGGAGTARGVAAPRIVASGEVEPRDAAERLLARVVVEVLGVRQPGVTDDLRAAGLTGIAEREIAARVSRETGATLDAAALFAVPTVEAAAEAVRQADDAEANTLIRPITAGGPHPPLLLAHPAGGTTGVYKALATLLGGSRPVFGLERLEGPVPERAARYTELILDRFPGGGWALGGWSFGGVLAYEIARQLGEAGHQVPLLVLLDAALPLPPGPGGESESLAHRFAAFAGYLHSTYGLSVRLSAGELFGLDEDLQLALLTERMSEAGIEDVLSPAILRHQHQSHLDTRALERYEPGKYDGPVVLYRTEHDTPWAVHDPRYQITSEGRGWDQLCPSLAIVPVQAHHLNLLDPPAVDSIAAHLRTLLGVGGHT